MTINCNLIIINQRFGFDNLAGIKIFAQQLADAILINYYQAAVYTRFKHLKTGTLKIAKTCISDVYNIFIVK